jgi:hypothetical protein
MGAIVQEQQAMPYYAPLDVQGTEGDALMAIQLSGACR